MRDFRPKPTLSRTRSPVLFSLALLLGSACFSFTEFDVPGDGSKTTVRICPERPDTSDILRADFDSDCKTDNDAIPPDTRIRWFRGTQFVQEGVRLDSANTAKGQTWQVQVSKKRDLTEIVAQSPSVLILNALPIVQRAAISPSAVRTSQDFQATVLAFFDHDGDEVGFSYRWTVDGQMHANTSSIIRANQTQKGQVWAVEITPHDGESLENSASATVARTRDSSLTIQNSPPQVLSLAITPDAPRTTDELRAAIQTIDADEDFVQFFYAWTHGALATKTSSTIPANLTEKDQIWTLSIRPDDGEDSGEIVTASVSIRNSPPQIVSLGISPDPARTTDILSANPVAEDADDGAITFTYEWSEALSSSPSVFTSSLAASHTTKDETWQVIVTAHDETETGQSATTEIRIDNSPPLITDLKIQRRVSQNPNVFVDLGPQDFASPGKLLQCLGAATDLDPGDTVTIGYEWQKTRGSTLGFTPSSPAYFLDLSAQTSSNTDEYSCVLSAVDNENSEASRLVSVEYCARSSLTFGNTAQDQVYIPNGTFLDLGAYSTMEAWIFWSPNSDPVTTTNHHGGYIYSRYRALYAETAFFISDAGALAFYGSPKTLSRFNLGPTILTATDAVPKHRWAHVAVVIEGQHIRLYIDGVRRAAEDIASGTYNPDDGLHAYLGRNYGNLTLRSLRYDLALPGSIANFRISNNARYAQNFTPDPNYQTDFYTQVLFKLDEEVISGNEHQVIGLDSTGMQISTAYTRHATGGVNISLFQTQACLPR